MSKKLDENALAELNTKIEEFNKNKTEFESTIELLKEEVKDEDILFKDNLIRLTQK